MLETLITVLNTRLKDLEIFSSLPGLAEQVVKTKDDEEKTFPAVYCSLGTYEQIRLEQEKATAYFRQISPFTTEETEDNSFRGCTIFETRTYNLVCVGVVPKNIYNTDDQFIDDKIALNIKKALTFANDKTIRTFLKASTVNSNVTVINTNRNDVIDQEYSGIKIQIHYDKVYFSIEFSIVITGDESCFDLIGCNNIKFSSDFFEGVDFIHSTNPFLTY